jgi:hypothetical protein
MMIQANPDTPSIPQSYLQMPYNLYVWLRKEFMLICKDMVEAMIMRVIEYEIEGDRRVWVRKATELAEQGKEIPEEPEWWIALSHKQIIARLYEAVRSEKTIIAKLKSLLHEKRFLLMRQNPANPYGSPQYTINKRLLQEKLNALPALPSARDAAKSQVSATPPPTLTPPPHNGTSPQNWGEGDPKIGGRETPKWGGGRPQNGGVAPSKFGGTNKKREKPEEVSQKKEREPQSPTPSHPDASLSLSPEISSAEENALPDSTCQAVAESSTRGGDVSPTAHTAPTLPIAKQPSATETQSNFQSQGYTNPTVPALGTVAPHDPGPAVSPLVAPSARIVTQEALRNDAPVSLLDQLTEEQAAFWQRWCGVSQANYNSLNETAYKHVVELAGKVASTEAMQSLYDYEFDRLGALARAKGTAFLPPRLGNLVNSDWFQVRAQKAQTAHKHTPGSGSRINYTTLGAFKDEPPLDYSLAISMAGSRAPKKPTHQPKTNTLDTAALLEQLAQRRAMRQQEAHRP